MKNLFYGAAIQGSSNKGGRVQVNQELICFIRGRGFNVISEHEGGQTVKQTTEFLEQKFDAHPNGIALRREFIRNRILRKIEDPQTCCCIFEVSTPSTGTGAEIAHAYLRPRIGITAIPILALYQTDYWPNGLSLMIRGINPSEIPLTLKEYTGIEEAKAHIADFLRKL